MSLSTIENPLGCYKGCISTLTFFENNIWVAVATELCLLANLLISFSATAQPDHPSSDRKLQTAEVKWHFKDQNYTLWCIMLYICIICDLILTIIIPTSWVTLRYWIPELVCGRAGSLPPNNSMYHFIEHLLCSWHCDEHCIFIVLDPQNNPQRKCFHYHFCQRDQNPDLSGFKACSFSFIISWMLLYFWEKCTCFCTMHAQVTEGKVKSSESEDPQNGVFHLPGSLSFTNELSWLLLSRPVLCEWILL